MSYTKIIVMLFIGLVLLGSVIFLYERGVNGGCEKVWDRYKITHAEDSQSFTCGYNILSIVIFIFGIIGLVCIGDCWDDDNGRYY